MAKTKKKRNKIYTGTDAAVTKPVITRVSASNRSKFGQWYFERKKLIKTVRNVVLVLAFIAIIVIEIINVASGKGL